MNRLFGRSRRLVLGASLLLAGLLAVTVAPVERMPSGARATTIQRYSWTTAPPSFWAQPSRRLIQRVGSELRVECSGRC
jgi:hypothetical protein